MPKPRSQYPTVSRGQHTPRPEEYAVDAEAEKKRLQDFLIRDMRLCRTETERILLSEMLREVTA